MVSEERLLRPFLQVDALSGVGGDPEGLHELGLLPLARGVEKLPGLLRGQGRGPVGGSRGAELGEERGVGGDDRGIERDQLPERGAEVFGSLRFARG
jgi:hypothetical protein